MSDEAMTERWDPDNVASRPLSAWQYYRNGVIVPITEDEARHNFDRWRIRSCDRGAATFMLDQLWNEIDQLRAANGVMREALEYILGSQSYEGDLLGHDMARAALNR